MRCCARLWCSKIRTSSSRSRLRRNPRPKELLFRSNRRLSQRRNSALDGLIRRRGASSVLVWWVASGCGPCGFQPDPGLKIVVPAMPSTLDWQTSDLTSWSNYPVLLATMRGLTSLDRDNRIGPALASDWEREETPDGREIYTFHLRTDVKWSDGVNSLCAEDFVVGWRRAMLGRERAEMTDLLGAYHVLARLEAGPSPPGVQPALHQRARAGGGGGHARVPPAPPARQLFVL